MKIVLNNEYFNRKILIEEKPCGICDSSIIQSMLITPPHYDTVITNGKQQSVELRRIGQLKVLLQEDINELLCMLANTPVINWDNKQLKFTTKNNKEGRTQAFSIPCFNKAHDRIIIYHESYTLRGCNSGEVYILIKQNGKWVSYFAPLWVT